MTAVFRFAAFSAVGICLILGSPLPAQIQNPFATSSPPPQQTDVTPTPASGESGAAASAPSATSNSAGETEGGVVNPFSSSPAATPAETPSDAAVEETAPPPGDSGSGSISGFPGQSERGDQDEAERARVLGLTTQELKREIEESKDRLTDLYARGQYDQALKEVEYLEKLSPGHPKAILIRQRIRERILQGKPIGVPIKEEFEQPVRAVSEPEPTPVEAQPIASETVPSPEGGEPVPPTAPGPVAAAESTQAGGMKSLIPILAGAAIVLLAAVVVAFLLMRRSRLRVQEAMSVAASSGSGRQVGAPSFPKPSTQPSSPASPPPIAVSPFDEQPAPSEEDEEGHLYDLPTMVLPDEVAADSEKETAPASQKEGEPSAESAPSSQEATGAGLFEEPEEAPSDFAFDFGTGETERPAAPEAPEMHETKGATFHPYGEPNRSIGDVVSGAQTPGSAGEPSALPPGTPPPLSLFEEQARGPSGSPESLDEQPAAEEEALDKTAFAPPPRTPRTEQPEEPEFPELPPDDQSGFQIPDILATDGTVQPGGLDSSENDHPERAASDFLRTSSDLSPSSTSSGSSQSQSGTGGVPIDDFLFSSGQGETDMQTRAAGEPDADSQPPPRKEPSEASKSGETGEDLTQMSFGQEFDRLMFSQPESASEASGFDQALGGETVGFAETEARSPEEETLLDYSSGASSSPQPSGGEDETVALSPSESGPPHHAPAPGDPWLSEDEETVHLHPGLSPSGAAPQPPANLDPSSLGAGHPPAAGSPPGGKPSAAPSHPSPGASQESLFQMEREKGLKAFEEQDWKQAVHFLSVAASLHPDDQELAEKLREARKQRRSAPEA
jgi:hypothetical protein